ncbi:MAG: SDR family NAD(P)-dependent oxidoreductase, partial [Hyphomonadaceae bacterium]|nr:SDR family NAD(P)-dependent oxidoreductase [Hyphomonadaceae bacterium]
MSQPKQKPECDSVSGPAESAVERPEYSGMTMQELSAMETVYRPGLFDGKVVMVTGAGSGMGRAMAFLFARLGARVVICGRREERLKETRDGIKRLCDRDMDYTPLNIRDADGVKNFISGTFDKYGAVDVLINSAGGQFSQEAIEFSRKGWLAVIDTNLNGTWWMMQETAKQWRER